MVRAKSGPGRLMLPKTEVRLDRGTALMKTMFRQRMGSRMHVVRLGSDASGAALTKQACVQ